MKRVSTLAVLLALGSGGSSWAELRVYDATSKQSVTPVSRGTTSQPVEIKQAPSQPSAKPLLPVSPKSQPATQPVSVVKPSPAPTQPSRLLTPQMASKPTTKLAKEDGGIYIFTTPSKYSSSIFKAYQQLTQEGHSRIRLFMDDQAPPTLSTFVIKNSEIIPEQGFEVDSRNLMAERLGVKESNTLAYVDGQGSIRLYHLPDELNNFQRQLSRQGATRKGTRTP